jgi:hypothetical protein
MSRGDKRSKDGGTGRSEGLLYTYFLFGSTKQVHRPLLLRLCLGCHKYLSKTRLGCATGLNGGSGVIGSMRCGCVEVGKHTAEVWAVLV